MRENKLIQKHYEDPICNITFCFGDFLDECSVNLANKIKRMNEKELTDFIEGLRNFSKFSEMMNTDWPIRMNCVACEIEDKVKDGTF